MSRLSFESVQPRVIFEKALSSNTELTLHNLVFKRKAHSFVTSSRLRFYMWVSKNFSYEIVLPEVDIELNFDFYADFQDLKRELGGKLAQKTQHLPESEYYAHFLTRIQNLDGFFSISKNRNVALYNYTVEIEFLNSTPLQQYLNIALDRLIVDAFGYTNDFPIFSYTPTREFSFQCAQLEKDPILDQKLRTIFLHARQGDLVNLYFPNIFYRRLKRSAYSILDFYWNAQDFRVLSFGVYLKEY